MRISDWSSDVCSSDLDLLEAVENVELGQRDALDAGQLGSLAHHHRVEPAAAPLPARDHAELAAARAQQLAGGIGQLGRKGAAADTRGVGLGDARSEEHASELQSLMRISYAVFCLKKKKK